MLNTGQTMIKINRNSGLLHLSGVMKI